MKKIVFLLTLVLCFIPAAFAENYVPVELTTRETYAMNLFLSNFTEVGIDKISRTSDSQILVDFAHDHMWFNDYESYEYGEYEDNNCRVADDRIPEIINRFFGDIGEVDLSQTLFDYDGEYYYHCETGGWTNSGFAHAMSVCPIGNDQYFVSFAIFCSGGQWDNSALDDGIEELIEEYVAPSDYGSAIVYAGDLADRDTYRMVSVL